VSALHDIIRRSDFFKPLDEKIIGRIVHLCIPREYSTGDHVVRQGDAGLGLYFITNGLVKVEIDREDGKTLVAELQSGALVGELSIIDGKPRSANIICVANTSCLLLTRDTFLKLMNKYPEIAIQTARVLATRLRNANERLEQYSIGVDEFAGKSPDSANPEGNSSGSPNDESAFADRNRVKSLLADSFGWSHVLKSLTRVSLAVVGCPVTVHPEARASEMIQTAIVDVKLVLFPTSEAQVLRLDAFDDGNFFATIFQPVAGSPAGLSVSRFEGHVRRNESAWLWLPAGRDIWMERSRNSPHPKPEPPKARGSVQLPRKSGNHSSMRALDGVFQALRER
jgi:hypothetical protein